MYKKEIFVISLTPKLDPASCLAAVQLVVLLFRAAQLRSRVAEVPSRVALLLSRVIILLSRVVYLPSMVFWLPSRVVSRPGHSFSESVSQPFPTTAQPRQNDYRYLFQL